MPTAPDDPAPAPFDLAHVIQAVVAVVLTRPFMRFLWGVRRFRSRSWLRRTCVFACNHRSFFDSPLVVAFVDRPVSYFARESLWRNPAVALFLNTLGGLPINRDQPQPQVLKRCIAWLKAGRSVLIFPEGTRTSTGRLGRFADGPAMLARWAAVPVVPVYVYGSERVWPRHRMLMRFTDGCRRVQVRYGPPILAIAGLRPRISDRLVTAAIRRWMMRQERRLLGPAL